MTMKIIIFWGPDRSSSTFRGNLLHPSSELKNEAGGVIVILTLTQTTRRHTLEGGDNIFLIILVLQIVLKMELQYARLFITSRYFRIKISRCFV